jgi:hypothetical protein
MPQEPFQLRYTLGRAQRLVPHVRLWGPFTTIFMLALFAFFCARTAVAVGSLEFVAAAGFGGLALGTFLVFRGLFIGIADVLIAARRDVDVVIDENTAGVMCGEERWYLFLDGFMTINKYRADVWTFQHFNGSVLHVLVSAITDEQMSHIRSAMERGRTPEGIRAVVERGRRIVEVQRDRRRE